MTLRAEPRSMPPNEHEIREGAWAIVKASRDLDATGHGGAVRWARGRLGLEDRYADRKDER